jgi:hypothetical protein
MSNTSTPPSLNQAPIRSSGDESKALVNWGKITIFSSGILIVVIILIIWYWFFTLRPQVNTNSSNQIEQSTENSETSQKTELNPIPQNWKEVSDEKLGIKFSHPPEWSVQINKKPIFYAFLENKNDWDLASYKEIILRSPDYSTKKTEDGGEEITRGSNILIIPFRNKLTFESLGKVNSNEVGPRDFEKKIIIDGESASRIDYTLETAFYVTEIYALRNGKAFIISRNYREGERSTYEEIFDKFLEGLKFTK